MPRPPRRTAKGRRADAATAAKPVHIDSPAPSSVIPSSPPLLRQRPQLSRLATSASVTSDLETVPSTMPLPQHPSPLDDEPASRASENLIARANEAASTLSKTIIPTSIEVYKTPSPIAIRKQDVLETSTPSPLRGTKRDSRTAFEEDFAESLMAADQQDEDQEENVVVQPDTPTRSSGGPNRKRVSSGARDAELVKTRTSLSSKAKGKMPSNPDDTIDFNYSSSPEPSPAARRFGMPKTTVLDDSEEEEEEEKEDRLDPEEQEEEAVVEPQPTYLRPRRRRKSFSKAEAPVLKNQTTKALQSLLPKRRATKPKPMKTSSKATKVSAKGKATATVSKQSRSALVDVTKVVLDEDELNAIDAPVKPLFGAGADILSDDELGREIYVDSSARSSSVGAPPTPPSPPRRTAAKGKGKAAAATGAEGKGKRPKRTYGKLRRQDSEISNKENDTPAKGRAGGASKNGKLADAASVALNKEEKKVVADIKKRFKEVDDWDLCFEDVVPESSDGLVKGGR